MKPGLLLARPLKTSSCEAGMPYDAVQARQPADAWVPNQRLRGPEAFDLAHSRGLRSGAARR